MSRPAPIWVERTSSTNDDVRALAAEGAPDGTAVVAAYQSAGRGRLGRSWQSAPGTAVLASMLVRRGIPATRAPLLCLAAAVAVAEAAGPAYRIKWPNDVLAPDGRKVAGILAEADPGGGWQILGLGLNVDAAPPLDSATCLAEADGHARDLAGVAHDVLERLHAMVDLAVEHPPAVLRAWRNRSATLGRRVRVNDVEGVAVDIDPDGALLVRLDAASEAGERPIRRILAGDVEMVVSGASPPRQRTPDPD